MNGKGLVSGNLPSSASRWLAVMAVMLAATLAGVLISASPQAGLWLLGFIGVVGYALLAYGRSFAAFVVLVIFALTVWLSGIKIVGDVSVMIGLGLIFTIVWLSRLTLRDAAFVKVREYRLLLALTAVVAISTLLNLDGPAGLSPVLTYLQLFLLFVLVVNLVTSASRLHALGAAIIVSSTLLAVVVLLDHFGWLAAGLVLQQTAGVNTGSSIDIVTRTGGLWGDANFTALQLTIALPFIMEKWPIESSWRKRALLSGAAGVILAAFAFTFSIGGLIGLATILLVKTIRDLQRNSLLVMVRTGLLIVIVFWALSVVPADLFLQRTLVKLNVISGAAVTLNSDLLLQAGSGRGDTWQAAVRSIGNAPLFGHGPGNAPSSNVHYSILFGSSETLSSHNMFLTVADELGLVGLVLFAGLLISAVFTVRPLNFSQTGDSILRRNSDALFIALVAYSVQGLALDIHNLKLLWILLGMAVACRQLFITDRSAAHDLQVMG